MPAWERRNIPSSAEVDCRAQQDFDWRLPNVRDIHLGEAQDGGAVRPATTARTIATFAIVALLILAMACSTSSTSPPPAPASAPARWR